MDKISKLDVTGLSCSSPRARESRVVFVDQRRRGKRHAGERRVQVQCIMRIMRVAFRCLRYTKDTPSDRNVIIVFYILYSRFLPTVSLTNIILYYDVIIITTCVCICIQTPSVQAIDSRIWVTGRCSHTRGVLSIKWARARASGNYDSIYAIDRSIIIMILYHTVCDDVAEI